MKPFLDGRRSNWTTTTMERWRGGVTFGNEAIDYEKLIRPYALPSFYIPLIVFFVYEFIRRDRVECFRLIPFLFSISWICSRRVHPPASSSGPSHHSASESNGGRYSPAIYFFFLLKIRKVPVGQIIKYIFFFLMHHLFLFKKKKGNLSKLVYGQHVDQQPVTPLVRPRRLI